MLEGDIDKDLNGQKIVIWALEHRYQESTIPGMWRFLI